MDAATTASTIHATKDTTTINMAAKLWYSPAKRRPLFHAVTTREPAVPRTAI